jgi:hypothetical protein
MSVFEDAWDSICDGFDYFISFEWWEDVTEGVGDAFSNLSEFSTFGLTFGILTVLFSYATRYVNLNGTGMGIIESMTQFMPPLERTLWTIISYVGSFVAGYFLGSYFENS